MEIVDELIFYSTIKGLRNWLSGYIKLFDLPGDLFHLKKDKLNFEILPSKELLKLHEEARRRYEKIGLKNFH